MLTRRHLLRGAGAAAAAAACAPAQAPAAPTTSGPAQAAWEREWEALVAAAKQEGKVVVATLSGVGYRSVVEAFERAFPGVSVEHAATPSATVFTPKALQERQAAIYSYDVGQFSPGGAIMGDLMPAGAFEPVRSAIIRPDVTGDENWKGGFEFGFLDKAKQTAYGFGWERLTLLWCNTDLVKDGEIKSVRDLLDPKWKGRMVFFEVTSGFTFQMAVGLRKSLTDADEVLKRLLIDQEPAISREPRQITEGLIRGRYAIGTGVSYPILAEFLPHGLGQNVVPVELPEVRIIGEHAVFLFNRAPHPNAAKVFINWLLTKEGLKVWSENIKTNVRRNDVPPVEPRTYPREDALQTHFRTHLEEHVPFQVETINKLREVVLR